MAEPLPFAWLLILALLRVGVVAVVAFLVLPRLALPGTASRSAWGRGWGDAVLGVSTTLVAAFLLGLAGLFDAASIAVTLLLALAIGAWLRYRRLWQRTLLQRYAALLRWIERIAPPDPVVDGLAFGLPSPGALVPAAPEQLWRRWWRRLRSAAVPSGWRAGLSVAALAAIGIRIIPDLASPAPLTLRYYVHLEALKGLAVGEPVGGFEGWGIHALAMALSELARVDPALVLRAVGAVAAGALTFGVYQTARFYWSRPLGAFAGAMLVAAGGPLLPLPLDHQAGAEPLMLAAALALAVFPHVSAYLGTGSRRGITVATFGLLACGLTHASVGLLLGATVTVYVLSIGLQVWIRHRRSDEPLSRRDRALGRRLGVMAAIGTGVGLSWLGYGMLVDDAALPSLIFLDRVVPVAFGGVPGRVAVVIGTLLVLAPFLPSRARHRDELPSTGALMRTGGQTLAMWAIWLGAGGGFEGLAGAAAVLLTANLGLSLGLLVNEVHVQVSGALAGREEASPGPGTGMLLLPVAHRSEATSPLPVAWDDVGRSAFGRAVRRSGWIQTLVEHRRGGEWAPVVVAVALLVLSLGTGWGVPVAGEPVEPDGYVRAYHAIQSRSLPYAWTAVSHRGTGILTRHRGRFMDYEYFLQNYDARRYDHLGERAIPTPDVYLFVEKNPLDSRIVPELMPPGDNTPERIARWVRAFAMREAPGVTVERFYDDPEVRVYRIARPAPTLLQLPDESAPRRRTVTASVQRPQTPSPSRP